jgi:hypothetical protein
MTLPMTNALSGPIIALRYNPCTEVVSADGGGAGALFMLSQVERMLERSLYLCFIRRKVRSELKWYLFFPYLAPFNIKYKL